tara:strand:- start:113 stop:538 length:426 start_codon:yes stop_codon:yes gene_type:complete
MMSEQKQKSTYELKQIKIKKQAKLDNEQAWIDAQPMIRKRVKAFALGNVFTLYIYAMIFANLATMGQENGVMEFDILLMNNSTTVPDTDGVYPPSASEPKIMNTPLVERLNTFFAIVFIVEFVLKLGGLGIKFYFRDHFNK